MLAGGGLEERAETKGKRTYTVGSLPQERGGKTARHRLRLRL